MLNFKCPVANFNFIRILCFYHSSTIKSHFGPTTLFDKKVKFENYNQYQRLMFPSITITLSIKIKDFDMSISYVSTF